MNNSGINNASFGSNAPNSSGTANTAAGASTACSGAIATNNTAVSGIGTRDIPVICLDEASASLAMALLLLFAFIAFLKAVQGDHK